MDYRKRFSSVSEDYVKGRRGYPEECFDLIKSVASGKKTLDLGCGTGISTRQLFEEGFEVVGADSDKNMIEKAEQEGGKIKYFIADADKLPFGDGKFDVVTAFASFHWFRNRRSLSEIERVLSDSGVFVVVNKRYNDKFRDVYGGVLNELFGKMPGSVKRGYSPDSILKRNGFRNVTKKIYNIEEKFSVDEALLYVKSTGTWGTIDRKYHTKALSMLRERFSKIAVDGIVKRDTEVILVYGMKK